MVAMERFEIGLEQTIGKESREMSKATVTRLFVGGVVAVVAGFAIHLLPLLMAVTMFWQQKMTPTDPRQAAMTYFMPALMLIFFYGLPSGLVLYWTANNAMTIGQQYLMQRGDKKEAPPQPAEVKPKVGPRGAR